MFVNFNILNQLGSPAINSNTFANRPAAGQTGRLFVSTDTFEIYRDNGTSWDLIGGPGSSTVTGTGASGQVTYWTGASTIAGNNNLFWDIANSRLGIGTTTPGHKLQINGTGTLLSLNGGSDTYMLFAGNGADQYQIGYTDNALDYRRFSIYDSTGAKEVLTIDKQSRNVGINYQYSSLADQPAYTFDVSGSIRSTDSTFLATNGTSQVGINTVSPVATALIQANKTDGYGLYLNYTTNTGSGTTATALWAINTTAGSGYSAVIEEKTPNTTGGQYPLAIKHSLSSGTAAAGMGTGLHFQLPDNAGTFKTTQLTIETTDAAAATYTTRYRFMAQVNNTSTPLAYLTSVGLGIGNVIPAYKLDVNGTVRAFGVGNTGNFLAVDTNPGGASVQLNPQYGTGLPILYTNGAFPLLLGTNNAENARFDTAGNLGLGVTPSAWASGYKAFQFGNSSASVSALFSNGVNDFWAVSNVYFDGSNFRYINTGTATGHEQVNGSFIWNSAPSGSAGSVASFTQYMTLNASGNLGLRVTPSPWGAAFKAIQIGTATAIYDNGTANGTFIGSNFYFNGTSNIYINNGTATAYGQSAGSHIWYDAPTGIAGNVATFVQNMILDPSGNLGIGITPNAKLDVNATSGTLMRVENPGIAQLNVGNGGLSNNYYDANNHYFRTGAGSTNMYLNSSGQLGIGTTAPQVRLDFGSSTDQAFHLYSAGVDYYGINMKQYDSMGFSTNIFSGNGGSIKLRTALGTSTQSTRLTVTDGGNILIGTTIDGGAKLTVNGALSINTTTNGTYSKLIVGGAIHCNNNTTATTTKQNQYGNFYANESSVTGGAGATTIYSNVGPEGSLFVVSGLYPTSGRRFVDLVLILGAVTTAPVVISSQTYNSPASRTYTNTGETIKLELTGTDTYEVFVTGMGGNEKT